MMRHKFVLALVVLAGCATQDIGTVSQSARFSSYPTDLFKIFESSCIGPDKTVVHPGPDIIECREFLSPAATGALVLEYEGTLDALPKRVIRLQAHREEQSYVVVNDVYIVIPQMNGGRDKHVRQYNTQVHRDLNTLYRHTGGIPD